MVELVRILFLTKQQYMGKDLLRDRFGRFFEIPKALGDAGHQVRGVSLKYWPDNHPKFKASQVNHVEWSSHDLNWSLFGFILHYKRLKQIAKRFAPDIVVGASDSMQVTLASALASALKIPLALDLYDNFESYTGTKLPGLQNALVKGIQKAAAIATVSDELRQKIASDYRPAGLLQTITNAVCLQMFRPFDRTEARTELGLPQGGLLMGTAGALTRSRGIDILYRAFHCLSERIENLYLIVAGPRDQHPPTHARSIDLGELPQAKVGRLYSALDVGVICNRRGAFGNYCFPQKLYEMIACRLPIVAPNIGATANLLHDTPQFLFDPDRIDTLVQALRGQLLERRIAQIPVPAWERQGAAFETLLSSALTSIGSERRDFQRRFPQLSDTLES